MASGVPMNEPGGGWAAMRGALQFDNLIRLGVPELELASYVMTGVHSTFERMNRAFGRSRTFAFLTRQ